MTEVKLTNKEQLNHDKIVDQLNQEYADSLTPEYIAEQKAIQTTTVITGIQLKLDKET